MESFRKFWQSTLGRALLITVLFLFVVTMFWTGAPPVGSQGEVAKVNETRIYKGEVDQAFEAMIARFGGQIDRRTLEKMISRDDLLQDLVRQYATIDAAREMGVIADPASIQETILAIPAFQDEQGQFSQARFVQVISSNGYPNAAAFRQRVERELLAEQLQGAFSDSAFATRQDLELLTRIGEQKRDLAWVQLSPVAFANGLSATDAEVQARYDANPSAYMTEEKLAVEYVEVKLETYAASQEVTEADVVAKYEAMVRKAGENAERRVAHILVSTASRSEQDAKARAGQVLARLAAGESFAKLAAEYSDDQGSAANGGDLGFLGADALEQPLASAVAALKVGDVSAAVKSADGLHLLKVLEINQVQVPTLASSRAELTSSLKRELAKAKYEEVVAELGSLAYESDNLQEPAGKLGLQVQSTGLFGRNGGPGFTASPKVLEEILAPEVMEEGRNSGVIDVADGHAVVVRLKEHQPSVRRPLNEVLGLVRAEVVHEKAAALVREKAAAIKAAVAAGRTLDDVAKEQGFAVVRQPGAQRATQGIPREIHQAAFRIARPAAGAVGAEVVGLPGGGQVVIAVSNVVDGTLLGIPEEELMARRGQLAGEFGRVDYAHFVESAVAAADVEKATAESKEGSVIDVLKDIKEKARHPGT